MTRTRKKNPSALRIVTRMYGYTGRSLSKELGVSQPTVEKILNEPLLMRGVIRNKLTKLLQLSPRIMEYLINDNKEYANSIIAQIRGKSE